MCAGFLALLNLTRAQETVDSSQMAAAPQILIPAMNPNRPVPSLANAFDGLQVNNVTLDITSVADLQTMMAALQSQPPVPYVSLPTNRRGQVFAAGFWSLQNPYWPPLPGNLYGLDSWPICNGKYILDDRQVDYNALPAALGEDATLSPVPSPMISMSMMASSLSTAYAYGNPVYLTNIAASFTNDGSITASFSIAGGTNFVPYDILTTTNLTIPVASWNWLGSGYTSNRYTFYEQPAGLGFYILAKPSKTMTVGLGNDAVGQCDVPYGLTNALQVAGGAGHSLALLNNGTVAAWGWNPYGQATVPTNLTGVGMVSAGWYHSVALLTNGTVTAWGFDAPLLGYYLTNVPANLTNASVISAQALHTLALRTNGTVVAWGYNTSFGETNVPAGLTNVTAISAGYQFNLVVSNGYVVAWGDNTAGQCNVPAGLSNVVDVAAGVYHSLALLNNGTVVAWGSDDDGETSVPVGLTNVVAIAAGGDPDNDPYTAYSMALKKDGTLVIWGADAAAGPFQGLTNVIGIAAGADHALAVRTGPPTPVITLEPIDEYQVQGSNATFTARGSGLYGVTYQWQTNGVSVLGATSSALTVSNVQPAQIGVPYRIVVGNEVGSIISSNAYLHLVTPPVVVSEAPLPTNQIVVYQTNVTLSVAATAPGISSGFPLSYQWQFNGGNISGATAAAYTFRATAGASGSYSVLVSNAAGSTNAVWLVTVVGTNGLQIIQQPTNQYQIAGGSVTFVSSAVSTNGVTYQWQFNGTNIAGATFANLTLPNVEVAQQGTYDVVVSDSVHTLTSSNASFVLVTAPTIISLTTPTNQVGIINSSLTLSVMATAPGQTNGFPIHYQWQFNGTNIPGQTSSNYTFTFVNSGAYSVAVTNMAGSTNVDWQVTVIQPGNVSGWGDNEYGESSGPLAVTNIIAIAAGDYHSVAVEDNGTVIQWGYNWGSVPANLTNAVSVAAGYDDSIALRSDGTVVTWGTNNSPANYVPSGLAGVKAVACGWDDNVALLTNGTVEAWGFNGEFFGWGDMTDTTGLTNITAVSAKGLHALALTSHGTVQAWGDDREGESDVPIGLSNVVAVAAGEQHSLALLNNGTVKAWGFNNAGQCNVPIGLSNVMVIAAGAEHSVALLNNGTIVSWGNGAYGQTNTQGLSQVKLVDAGGDHTLANVFSSLVSYPVNVSQDLLLIYNTNSIGSRFLDVCNG